MNLKSLKEILGKNKNASLQMKLGNGEFVPAHFHITEVGRIDKKFVDCGGTQRESTVCSLQVWFANDTEHRLGAEKLLKILKLGENILCEEDLPVEIQYGNDVISQYFLSKVETSSEELIFVLTGKQAECLAPEKCGVKNCCKGNKCC